MPLWFTTLNMHLIDMFKTYFLNISRLEHASEAPALYFYDSDNITNYKT